MTITAAPGSGLGASLASGIEDAYGTLAVVDKSHPFDSFEVKQAPVNYEGVAMHGDGRLVRYDSDVILTNADAGGTAKSAFYLDGMGRWLAALMGTLDVAPTQLSTTTAYQQVHTWQSAWGKSLSFQQIIPDVSQVGHVWNTLGAKITQGQFECSAGSALMSTFTIDAQDRFETADGVVLDPATGTGTFAWPNMVVKVGTFGSEAKVDGVSKWTGVFKRTQADKRFNAGNLTTNPAAVYTIKDEPVDNAIADLTGTLETEYLSDALFENYYQTRTPFSLRVEFTSALLAGTGHAYSVIFAMPRCRFLVADDPTVPGPDIVKPSMPYVVLQDGTNPPATITIICKDTTL